MNASHSSLSNSFKPESQDVGAFAFAQQVIRTLKKNEPEETTGRGTLIFTGATAGVRGNVMTSAFASAKHGVRALSQSLAKEFGKEEIHVSADRTA